MGHCVAVWNNTFTRQNYTGLLAYLRQFFIQANASGVTDCPLTSEMEYSLTAAFANLNGVGCARDLWGNTLWAYINSPRIGFAAPVDLARVGALTSCQPCVLADVWMQLKLQPHLLWAPALSQYKKLTGLHDPEAALVPLGAGGYTTPVRNDQSAREVQLNSVPEISAVDYWNQKLVWHSFTASLYSFDGNVYAAGVPASTHVIGQKLVPTDWTTVNLIGPSILRANTHWMPFMTPGGLRVAVGVTGANNAGQMSAVMAGASLGANPAWRLWDVVAMPNVILDGGGGKQRRMGLRRGGEHLNGSSSSDPVPEAADPTA
jgi:hypothetical protein